MLLGSIIWQMKTHICFTHQLPPLLKEVKGGFGGDVQPIESLSISLLSKGRGLFMPHQFHSSSIPQLFSTHDSRLTVFLG